MKKNPRLGAWREMLADERPTKKQAAATLAHLAERGVDTGLIEDGLALMVGGLPEPGEDDDESVGEAEHEAALVLLGEVVDGIEATEAQAVRSNDVRRNALERHKQRGG